MSEKIPPIGTLTDRVQVQRKIDTPEPGGGHETMFVPSGTVWARVRGLSGRFSVMAEARAANVSHSVVLRFRTDLGPGDRFLCRGRRLEIVSASDMNGRRAYLNCACAETEFVG